MSEINGFDNEYEFVKYLNDKKINELSPMYSDLIDYLFPEQNKNFLIKCWRNHYKQKSDIFIKVNGIMKGVSIKKGAKNSMHVERLSDFTKFLEENNVDKTIIKEYLLYHFADGTINGRGKKRLSSEEYKKEHQNEIDVINSVFNNKQILISAIERFVLKGNNSDYLIDAIICGEWNDFIFLRKEDIYKIILNKKECYSTAVHFGPLIIQPKTRCLNHNQKYEKDRFSVQVKWYSLFDDIIENMFKQFY